MLWLILGLIIGAGAVGLTWYAQARQLQIRWYEWLLGAAGIILALLAIQNYLASFAELEPQAAPVLMAMFGVPAVILAGIAVFLVWRRQRAAVPAKA
jgi:hypothetical protein